MKRGLFCVVLACMASLLSAQDKMMCVYHHSGEVPSFPVAEIDSVTFTSDQLRMRVHQGTALYEYAVAEVDSLVFTYVTYEVKMSWDTDKVQVVNPFAGNGVDVTVEGTDVTVRSATETKGITYELQGACPDGMLKVYSTSKYNLRLNGLSLTNADGPALNSQSKKACAVYLVEGTQNTLSDAKGYPTSSLSGEDQKGTMFAEGQFEFSGTGSLTVNGYNNHAICSDDYLFFAEGLGTVTVARAANDGIHGKDYTQIDGGTLSITSSGDAIDGGGYVLLNGGNVTLAVLSDSIKKEGLKADTSLIINGGMLTVKNASNAGKCIKSGGVVRINGGTMKLTNTGTYILASGDVSTSSGIKSDGNVYLNGGDLTFTNSCPAGKGISSDGTLTMTAGRINGTFTGTAISFTNSSNQQDASSSKCLASDGAMALLAGSVTSTSSGTAGKGIVSQSTLTIGNSAGGPILNITTTGAKLTVSGSSTGGGGGGWNPGRPGGGPGGGGDMDNSGGSSPKAIKSMSAMVVNSGSITVKTGQDGGEGLESKSTMTINGGTIEATTYDDALNAATNITVNGGNLYCYSSGNDGIDSNGTLTFNGGVVVSSGTSAPEEGFDCDNNAFTITGGVLIGTGGATSNPTVTTQKYVKFSGVSMTSGQIMRLSASSSTSGTSNVLVYKLPRTMSSATILLSSSELKSGTSYYLFTGATLSSGTETFHGYYQDAVATGGTSKGSATAK